MLAFSTHIQQTLCSYADYAQNIYSPKVALRMALSCITFDIFDLENTVTLKSGQASLTVIETGTIR